MLGDRVAAPQPNACDRQLGGQGGLGGAPAPGLASSIGLEVAMRRSMIPGLFGVGRGICTADSRPVLGGRET